MRQSGADDRRRDSGETAADRPSRPAAWLPTPTASIALTMILFGAILVLSGIMVWHDYKNALAAAEARARSSAHVVAAHIGWMMEASDQALRRIDTELAGNPAWATPHAIVDISEALADLPRGFQYSVYDETGRLRLSNVVEAVDIEVGDREYFQRLRDGAHVVVSPQLQERLSREKVFIIARRLSHGGNFRGAASIAVPASRMAEFWDAMELGPYSSVSLIRDDGWLVARHPPLPEAINLSESALFTTHLPESPRGVYHSAVSPADGKSRIVGYWQVAGWPLVAAAGVDREEALESFHSLVTAQLLFGVPILGLLLAASIWITRLLRADMASRRALEEANERNQFLLREIHHRVKNNLQAVSSLVQMHPLPAQVRSDVTRRIAAMIAVHEQIYRSDQFDRVEVAPYAEQLVRQIAAAYESEVRIDFKLEPLTVSSDHALPLGLIINEVVSNAFKHAFAGRRSGRLEVALASEEGTLGRLTIRDDGPDAPRGGGAGQAGEQPRRGMGSRLIAGFAGQIGGYYRLEHDSEGTTFSMSFPLQPSETPAAASPDPRSAAPLHRAFPT